ncbi:putative PCM1-phosphoacetylglucosamine mutase [Testicularia cyperi]|uniref:Phosphoacetylglucosamine mutase n=1 Tax=Testicularia cyperi TaxID=1882483 RepID=A0A317XKV6_9BASI|nr:putative PCM1-phosphoacetylglucosamine mutase [Testicularia cyperi]
MALPTTISAAQAHIGQGLPTALITTASEAHPKPSGQKFTYGTAGLRTKADILDSTCFRVGLIGALRSKKLGGKTIGLMVTASHNPEEDNGVKMVDPRGEMLDSAWEPFCTRIANADSSESLIAELEKLATHFKIDLAAPASVIVGYDTRPSCALLVQAIVDGLSAMGAQTIDAGLKTTPQLHYLVRCLNTQGTQDSYGEPTEEGYYKKLAAAYLRLVGPQSSSESSSSSSTAASPLVVDCANGVGAYALNNLIKYIPEDRLAFRPLRTSTSTPGALNSGCGADYVKTNQCLPQGFEKENLNVGERMCSFDGDADRVVFYYLAGPAGARESFRLLDGDKIASLAADYLSELVKKAGIHLELGCVQTAYANGSSTKYLKQRVPVTCTPTGVKHLHHAAESFDIGVYFEANGHGTVLFSPSAQRKIAEATPASPAAQEALEQLSALVDLINQTVGDAISDMLLVEVILRARQWAAADWDTSYQDLPNKILKVNVPDRFLFQTEDAERRLTSPPGLQDKLDQLVAKFKDARSFVRPSGTEDCVRVYAECAIQSELSPLANGVAKLVADFAAASAAASS